MLNRSEQRDLILVGFMGAGKTAVGQELARLCGLQFVDLDQMIAEQAGMSIPEIFRIEGEESFRLRETQALNSLGGPGARVVATGGGIVGLERNWQPMRDLGPLVYLRATKQTLFARIGDGSGRPLASGDDSERQLAERLAARNPLYERADVVVDTDDLDVAAVAAAVLAELERGGYGCWRR